MNSPHESMGVAAIGILSRMRDRPRAARPRRFRPLAEPMEPRVVLSHVTLTRANLDPITIGRGPSAIVDGQRPCTPSGPGTMDTVEVNGQVELQPGAIVLS